MTKIDQERLDPVSFAGGVLDPHRQFCAFVNSQDEEDRILDPFVIEGLARETKISCPTHVSYLLGDACSSRSAMRAGQPVLLARRVLLHERGR